MKHKVNRLPMHMSERRQHDASAVGAHSNLPSARVRSLTDRLARLQRRVDELQFDCHEIRAELRALAEQSSGRRLETDSVVVYEVREVRVRAFVRRRHLVVRVK